MSKPKFLCIVAGQRAGTTALRSALAGTGKFFNHGEIFHTDDFAPGAYLPFVRSEGIKVEELATEDLAKGVAQRYLKHLLDVANGKIPAIDVKLNSWHAIRPFWGYVHQSSFFLERLIDQGTFFIFIRRKALVEQVLSEQVARKANKWHSLTEEDLPEELEVDIPAARQQARLIIQSENHLLGRIKFTPHVFATTYEELYPDGQVNPDLISQLASRFEIQLPPSIEPLIKKNKGNKKSVVTNYAEAEREIKIIVETYGRLNLSIDAD